MAFALRIVRVLFFVSLYTGLFCLALYILSNGIQMVGNYFGYEVGSLWGWLKSIMPRFPKRNKKGGE